MSPKYVELFDFEVTYSLNRFLTDVFWRAKSVAVKVSKSIKSLNFVHESSQVRISMGPLEWKIAAGLRKPIHVKHAHAPPSKWNIMHRVKKQRKKHFQKHLSEKLDSFIHRKIFACQVCDRHVWVLAQFPTPFTIHSTVSAFHLFINFPTSQLASQVSELSALLPT